VPDLVAVRDGEPDAMLDQAIAALGGMGRFVPKDATVVVKPNMGWARERGDRREYPSGPGVNGWWNSAAMPGPRRSTSSTTR